MDNWLVDIVDDVDSLYVQIDNLNDPLIKFCSTKSIDLGVEITLGRVS
jgi:hypothetical protein